MTGKQGSGSWFEHIMLVLNTLVLIGLTASYAGGSISPEKLWQLAFFAMSYPIILALTGLFSLFWLLKRKWYIFLNVAMVLLNWSYVAATVQLPVKSNTEKSASEFKVMTFNVRLFDRFNWTGNSNTRAKTIEFIQEQEVDILCIQEYYNSEEKDLNLLATENVNRHLKNYFPQRNNKNDYGLVIYTKYPIVDKGTIVLENSRDALTIYCDIAMNSDTLRIYNIHLQSLNLGKKGYQMLDELIETPELQQIEENRFLLSRMKSGFLKRAAQADKIAIHIAESPYPVIVCGDFNDVPTSYSVQQISEGLSDSFSKGGSGIGATYVKVPFFRIDNIFVPRECSVKSHVVHNEQVLSDHYAITSTISLPD
jgi:endonuclease/exonuclease/phosphatase family metal-dependent hydrolase